MPSILFIKQKSEFLMQVKLQNNFIVQTAAYKQLAAWISTDIKLNIWINR